MKVDTRGLEPEHLEKRLRIELTDGTVEEITLHELTVCETLEPCCGITYTLLAANRVTTEKKGGSVYWVAFGDIKTFQALGEPPA